MVSNTDKNQEESWSLTELLLLGEFLERAADQTSESRPRRSLRELSFEELIEELASESS